ncbi:hypothetical protein AB3K78_02135 [Leucobacter sp. HNU]|uniref:hypothetical protein n=1 Tax=Leucobacter sp. HNU TaxID=3236805 RepID=UPI003A80A547
MRKKLLALALVSAAISLPLVAATPAMASTQGSFARYCSNETVSNGQHVYNVTCRTPAGTKYAVNVGCGWYSAGHGGSFTQTSAWTTTGQRVSVSCGGAYVAAVPKFVWYK